MSQVTYKSPTAPAVNDVYPGQCLEVTIEDTYTNIGKSGKRGNIDIKGGNKFRESKYGLTTSLLVIVLVIIVAALLITGFATNCWFKFTYTSQSNSRNKLDIVDFWFGLWYACFSSNLYGQTSCDVINWNCEIMAGRFVVPEVFPNCAAFNAGRVTMSVGVGCVCIAVISSLMLLFSKLRDLCMTITALTFTLAMLLCFAGSLALLISWIYSENNIFINLNQIFDLDWSQIVFISGWTLGWFVLVVASFISCCLILCGKKL